MDDVISRRVAIDAVETIGHIATMPDGDKCIRRSAVKYTLSMLPSAQPETHEERTETHACDCISRAAAIGAIKDMCEECDSSYCGECRVNFPGRKDCEKVLEGLPSVQPEPQWIPCSERVPEEDEQVLVYLYDSPYIAWIDSNGEWNTEEFTLDKEKEREDEPIAWMPLPEPYKERREE